MNFPAKKVMPRYMVFAVLFFLVGVAVVVKIGYLMTAERGFWAEVDKRFVREGYALEPTRGNILADNGEVLASSIPEYELYMDYMSYEKDSARRAEEQFQRDSTLLASLDSISEGLAAAIPGTTAQEFRDRILQGRARGSHHWKLYSRRVSHVQYSLIKALPVFRKSVGAGGFTAERFFKRKNPYGRLGIHTIGQLYSGKDSARSGLELSFDTTLRGTPGLAHRQRVFNTYATIVDKPAVDGCDVHTTMDINMQDIVEEALLDKLNSMESAEYGICILMDVPTGDVKAMVTLSRAKDGHFYYMDHLALSQLMDPGSVFKPMSWLVALDDGKLHLDDMVNAHGGQCMLYGSPLKDSGWRNGGPGMIPAIEAIERSSNVAVGTTIDRLYHSHPWDFVEGLDRIGVRADLHLPFKEYKAPKIRMPKRDWSNWSKTALAWMSFGYESQVPPITTITFYNGIANGGKMVRPRFVTKCTRGDEVVQEFPVEVVRERMAKPEAINDIQKCLSAVVKGKHATAKLVRSKLFEISGKTGTAQIWDKNGFKGNYLVSFAGYFPSDAPQYSMIVCVKAHGSVYGGSTCGPVFKRVAETVMSQHRTKDLTTATDSTFAHTPLICAGNMSVTGRVAHRLSMPAPLNESDIPQWGYYTGGSGGLTFVPDTTQAGRMPDLSGYGLRDAVFRMESLGLHVKPKGVGYVGRQSIKPGSAVHRGDTVYIYLGNKAEMEAMADSTLLDEAEDAEVVAATDQVAGAEAVDAAQSPSNTDGAQSPSNTDGAQRNSEPAKVEPQRSAPSPQQPAPSPNKPRQQPSPAGTRPTATPPNKRQ